MAGLKAITRQSSATKCCALRRLFWRYLDSTQKSNEYFLTSEKKSIMKKIIVTTLFALVLTACVTATPPVYTELSAQGGYITEKIDKNRYIVMFSNKTGGYSSAITAVEYTFLGAAELAIQRGKGFFTVLKRENNDTKLTIELVNQDEVGLKDSFVAEVVRNQIRSRKSHNFYN